MYNKNESNFLLCNTQYITRRIMPLNQRYNTKQKNSCQSSIVTKYPYLIKDFQITNLLYKKNRKRPAVPRNISTMPKEINLTITNFKFKKQFPFQTIFTHTKLMVLSSPLPSIMQNKLDASTNTNYPTKSYYR